MKNVIALGWELCKKILTVIVYKILRLPVPQEKWEHFLQFVKFGLVGLSNNVIYYILYVISLLLFHKFKMLIRFDYLVAQFIGFLISVLWSFYWNRKYVFRLEEAEGVWLKVLLKSYISYAFTGIILDSVLAIFWVEVCHIPKLLAPIISLIITVPLNYALNKYWAFRKSQK